MDSNNGVEHNEACCVVLPWHNIVSPNLHLGMIMESIKTLVKYIWVRFICLIITAREFIYMAVCPADCSMYQ